MKKKQNELERLQLAAFSAFKSEKYNSAIEHYKKILEIIPNDLTTQYNIAVASQQSGQIEEAKNYYSHYLTLKKDAKAFNNLAVIALKENDTELAKTYFKEAIDSDAHYLSAYSNLIQLYIQDGNITAASDLLSSCSKLQKKNEADSEFYKNYWNIANIYFAKKDYQSAFKFFQQALELVPKEHKEKINQYLAGCMVENGDLGELKKYASIAYEMNASDSVNIYHLGVYYFRSLEYDQARIYFTKALESNPNSTLYLGALASLNIDTEEYDAALETIKKAYELEPQSAYILNTYGRIYLVQGMYSEALELFLGASEKTKSDSFTLANIGTAYMSLNMMQEAQNYLLESLKLNPQEKDALINMGQISYKRGQYRDAIHWFNKAREHYPDLITAHQNLAVMHLGLYEFDEGWEEYRYRQIDKFNLHLVFERGNVDLPKNLNGKRILLRHEQGLGDEIFFLRFVSILKERGAWIAYFPNPKLFDVLLLSSEIDYLVKEKETIASIDYDLFVGELPRLLQIHSIDMIFPPFSLSIRENVQKETEDEFKALKGPLIGITWRAGIQRFNFLSKDISLAELIARLKDIDATIVILQRNPTEHEINELEEAFGDRIVDASSYNDDLVKMVSLLSILDIYIAVSNTNVHLAASIGKKCHVLVPFPPDWRWGYDSKQSSPWFQGFSTYHQRSFMGDWDEALEMLIDDVKKDLNQKKEFEQFKMIINESIVKVEELIEHAMLEDAQRLCEKLLSLDRSNQKVLGLLSKILLSSQQLQELEKAIDMSSISAN